MKYLLYKCRNCGRLNMAKSGQKSRHCAFCGVRNRLREVEVLAKAESAGEARKAALWLKAQRSLMKKI